MLDFFYELFTVLFSRKEEKPQIGIFVIKYTE
jgi:hypothetical protein